MVGPGGRKSLDDLIGCTSRFAQILGVPFPVRVPFPTRGVPFPTRPDGLIRCASRFAQILGVPHPTRPVPRSSRSHSYAALH